MEKEQQCLTEEDAQWKIANIMNKGLSIGSIEAKTTQIKKETPPTTTEEDENWRIAEMMNKIGRSRKEIKGITEEN